MIRVLFFLGWDSHLADAEAWLKSARAQRPDIDFMAWPYPAGAGASEAEALTGFSDARFDQVIALIRELPSEAPIVVAGHSSGAAISNAVVRGLGASDNLRLIALDGFPPGDDIYALHPNTECWSAECGSARSLNWSSCCTRPNFHVYPARNCYTEWALHFSLVNKAASDDLVGDIAHGYSECFANLDVLTLPASTSV